MSKNWKVLESKTVLDTPFCKFHIDSCELPDGRIMPKYYVLDFTDWVNVVPVTKDGKIVLIRQYRHASGEETIEIPGGAVHPDEGQTPKDAASRELEEETGYVAESIVSVGTHSPNPALQSNSLHTYVAKNCELLKSQDLDPFEDIEVFTVTLEELVKLVFDGKIRHSLIVASIFMALPELGFSIRA